MVDSVWSHVHFDNEKIEVIMELIHSRDCLLFAHRLWENTLLCLLHLFFDKFTLKTTNCSGLIHRHYHAPEFECGTTRTYACMYVYCCVWLCGQDIIDTVCVVSK